MKESQNASDNNQKKSSNESMPVLNIISVLNMSQITQKKDFVRARKNVNIKKHLLDIEQN